MNKIDTSQIIDPSTLQPFIGPSLEFLQNATKESIRDIVFRLYGPLQGSGLPLVMWGLQQSGSIINEGAIFDLNQPGGGVGEMFYVASANTSGFVNPPLLVLDVTNDPTADPVEFTDGVLRNVHNVRRMKWVDQPQAFFYQYLYSDLQQTRIVSGNVVASGAWSGAINYVYNPLTNMVVLSGNVSILGSGSIAALPVGIRPSAGQNISATFVDDSNWQPGRINIANTGVISFQANFAGSTTRSATFNGISYFK